MLTVLVLLISQGGCTAQKINGKATNAQEEEALIVYIRLSDEKSGKPDEREKLFKLEDQLLSAIEKSGAGQYDGNEIGEGFFTLYMYGPSAARLWEAASPIVKASRAPSGSYVIKRYGRPGAKQDRISLSE
jgi:hypothetical protein